MTDNLGGSGTKNIDIIVKDNVGHVVTISTTVTLTGGGVTAVGDASMEGPQGLFVAGSGGSTDTSGGGTGGGGTGGGGTGGGGTGGGGTGGGTGGSTVVVVAAPSNLTAVAASEYQIDLAWVNNATNQTGFVLERKFGANGAVSIINIGAALLKYSDKGLMPATTYSYRLKAINGSVSSAYAEASATTKMVIPVPEITDVVGYPNPISPDKNKMVVSYGVNVGGTFILEVYDLRGKMLIQKVNLVQSTGKQSFDIEAEKLAPGYYYYYIRTTGDKPTKSPVKGFLRVK